MKNLLLILAFISLSLNALRAQTGEWPDGIGTEQSPFLVSTWQHLYWISQNSDQWDKYYVQTADIDFADATPAINTWDGGKGWTPIAQNESDHFFGHFNGNGYEIRNLYINRPDEDYIAFIGRAWGATLTDIRIVDADITGNDYTSPLVGFCTNDANSNYSGAIITKCFSSGEITGNDYVGGIVGYLKYSILTQSASEANINGVYYLGGLIGASYPGQNNDPAQGNTIENCYATGTISGSSDVGGLIGMTYYSTIENCYSIGAASAEYTAGGLVARDYESTVTSSYWNTETSGQTVSAGGEGKTTAEMQQQSTYTDWDFESIWMISSGFNGGYPAFIVFEPQGDGTAQNPYQMATWHNLVWVSENASEWSKHFVQTGDISFPESISTLNDGAGFSPIGNNSKGYFTGSYNGQGYTIDGLFINRPDQDHVGLFGYVETNEGSIENVNLTDAYVVGGTNVGALAGYIWWTNVTNCEVAGVVQGFSHVGGLIGRYGWTSTLKNCSSSAVVTGQIRAGGLVGHFSSGSMKHCSSNGAVDGEEFVGGLIGEMETGSVTFCNSAADVNRNGATDYSGFGGLIGRINVGTIETSYSTGSVTATESYEIGGFAGMVNGTIRNCYSTATVEGGTNVGGFAGYLSNGTIQNCYAIGIVSGATELGGLIGFTDGGTVTASYWDTDASGMSTSAAGEGKTTAELQTESTFTNWDFETIWVIDATINDGYPSLRPDATSIVAQPVANVTFAPNPFTSTVSIIDAENVVNVVFVNMAGQVVLQQTGNGLQTIDTENLESGIYVAKVQFANGTYAATRLIKR